MEPRMVARKVEMMVELLVAKWVVALAVLKASPLAGK